MVAKEVYIIETVVFWHWDNGWMTEKNSFGVNSAISIIICTRWLVLITQNWNILNRAIFSRNMHWWANKAQLWLLRTLTYRIILIYQFICQWLSLPLYNTHPTWLSLTNELKFVDYCHSLSLVNLLQLINKFSFICEGQSCRVRITFSAHYIFVAWLP